MQHLHGAEYQFSIESEKLSSKSVCNIFRQRANVSLTVIFAHCVQNLGLMDEEELDDAAIERLQQQIQQSQSKLVSAAAARKRKKQIAVEDAERRKQLEAVRLRERLAELAEEEKREVESRKQLEDSIEKLRLRQQQQQQVEAKRQQQAVLAEKRAKLDEMTLKRLELERLRRAREDVDEALFVSKVQIDSITVRVSPRVMRFNDCALTQAEKKTRVDRDLSDLDMVLERAKVLKVTR